MVTISVTVMALTDRAILNLKPQEKHVFVADGDGLYLRVHPTGAKSFLLRTRVGGRAKWTTIGSYPAMSLAEARRRVREIEAEGEPSRMKVQACYDAWQAHVDKEYKSPDQVRYRMARHFVPAFGTRAISEITRAELSEHLAAIAEQAPVQANRVLGDVKQMFTFAVARGWLENSPAHLLTKKAVGGKERSRDRVLADAEIVELVKVLRTDRFAPKTRIALALLLLLGQRSGETRAITKKMVAGQWLDIPKQVTKTGAAQKVYLGFLPSRLIRLAFKEYGSAPFEGMEGQVLSKAVARMQFDPPFTPHDLRRTMATKMADMGIHPHVVEKCLNHKMSGVMAVYNRAEYLPERAAAWRQWERYVVRLVQAAKKKPRGTANLGAKSSDTRRRSLVRTPTTGLHVCSVAHCGSVVH